MAKCKMAVVRDHSFWMPGTAEKMDSSYFMDDNYNVMGLMRPGVLSGETQNLSETQFSSEQIGQIVTSLVGVWSPPFSCWDPRYRLKLKIEILGEGLSEALKLPGDGITE